MIVGQVIGKLKSNGKYHLSKSWGEFSKVKTFVKKNNLKIYTCLIFQAENIFH